MITETLMQVLEDLQITSLTIDNLEKKLEPVLMKRDYTPLPGVDAVDNSPIGGMVDTLSYLVKELNARLESITNNCDL